MWQTPVSMMYLSQRLQNMPHYTAQAQGIKHVYEKILEINIPKFKV
jgi:hypothetical protein